MKRARQLGFEMLEGSAIKNNAVKHFGGAYLGKGNPKEKRPISIKRAMHLVVRSTLARGSFSFLRKDQIIRDMINKQGKDLNVRVYRIANGGNHLHLVVLPRSRTAFNNFIRAISGLIAREILGIERGPSAFKETGRESNIRFWDKRPFTRIIEWGREYNGVSAYLLKNSLEAIGFIPYTPRKHRLIKSTA